MDIYERIKADHDQARELMASLGDTTARAVKTRKAAFETFKLDMWAHHKVEEAVFYAFLLEGTDMRGDSFEALNEHHVANGLIEELDTIPVDSEEWGMKFKALCELVSHHIDEEEKDFFPKARKIIPADVATLMGERFDDRKAAVLAAISPMQEKDFAAA